MTRQEQLKQLHQTMEAQAAKLPLVTQPQDIVHGEGTPPCEIMLIGEAPGYFESVQRRPFVGRSGQFLRQTLTKVGLAPETVFISNIVKVRPPDNRDPTPEEIEAFRPFLNQEITIVNPQLIITLGRFSMQKFLPNVKISQVHGRLHQVSWTGGVAFVLPMYHPAAALRSTQLKNSFVADFDKVAKIRVWVKSQLGRVKFESDVKDTLL